MLRSIGEFISEITGGGRRQESFEETDYRLAAAALLVHVIASDDRILPAECDRLRDVLAHRFQLGAEETARLIESAMQADREAVDLYQFTSVLNRSLDDAGRRHVVEMMFEVAYADGQLSEFEDNIVWRAAELMHVPSRERVTMRSRLRDAAARKEN